jgi:hypothetical protein
VSEFLKDFKAFFVLLAIMTVALLALGIAAYVLMFGCTLAGWQGCSL